MIKRQNEDCNTGGWTSKRGLARNKRNVKDLWIRIREPPPEEARMLGQPEKLKVGKTNLHHSSVPSIDLLQYMDKEKVDVALV
ncbi:hypothetical protein ACLKA7_005554 [Drosophila subpalustris]